jgi:thymidylate synthase
MRTPKEFPKLEILKKYNHSNNKLNDKLEYLENLTYDDFKLIDYNHHGTIKAKMIA